MRGVNQMWGVFKENRLIKSFSTKDDAEQFCDKKNLTWQTCGFYVQEVQVETEETP